MRTKIGTLVMLISLFLTNLSFAKEKVSMNHEKRAAISKIIESEISFPEFSLEEDELSTVSVDISIKSDGSILVNACNSSNQKMKAKCIEKLNEIKSKKLKAYAGERVLLKINYKFYQ